MASVSVVVPLPRGHGRFLAGVLAAPLLLAVFHALPETGAGLGLRLAAAAACVLVLPGALILRAIGWPESLGVAAAGALAWSLGVVFFAFAVTFAAEGSLTLTVAVIGIFTVAAVVPAAMARADVDRADGRAVLGVVAAGALFAGLVWWASRSTIGGDALFHLARARKLEEFDVLYSVRAANEFADGGLHPGYAFPLWHGVLALVARLGGVDVAEVVRHLAAVLVPLSFLVAYGAGRALFRSWAGGVAVATAQVAQIGFSRGGTGSFELLALPPTVARVLLVPAVLALAFALVEGAGWSLLGALGAAGLALAVIHPTYALFLAVPLAGFLAVRLLLAPGDRVGHLRIAASLPALVVPFGLYTLWILPVLNSTIARGAGDRARSVGHYADRLDLVGDAFRLAPETISRGGAVVVAALAAVPLAALAPRRRWAAFVLGGTLAVLTIVLVPTLFTALSDAVSLSQSRRLVLFLPLPFALAGAALALGRLRLAGVGIALLAGGVLRLGYSGAFGYRFDEGGPAWPVWVAVFGGFVALILAALLRLDRRELRAGPWAAAAAVAFAIPIAAAGVASAEPDGRADRYALTPGLVQELRNLEKRKVVLADLEASYRLAAYAPLYVVAAPPAHVARTKLNQPYNRRRDIVRFFFRESTTGAQRRKLLRRYLVRYVLVDKTRKHPEAFLSLLPRVYEDERYLLFLVEPR